MSGPNTDRCGTPDMNSIQERIAVSVYIKFVAIMSRIIK